MAPGNPMTRHAFHRPMDSAPDRRRAPRSLPGSSAAGFVSCRSACGPPGRFRGRAAFG